MVLMLFWCVRGEERGEYRAGDAGARAARARVRVHVVVVVRALAMLLFNARIKNEVRVTSPPPKALTDFGEMGQIG